MQVPYTTPFIQSELQKSGNRFASLMHPFKGEPVEVGILGVPSDTGVIQGGGRAGAAFGPDAIRQQMMRYGARYNIEREVDLANVSIADFGNLIPDGNFVEKTHERLSEAVSAMIRIGVLPILLGGGHDLSFGGVKGLSQVSQDMIGGVVLDAHFDVREAVNSVITSGTPFRNILEKIDSMKSDAFVEIGINGLVNEQEHLAYLQKQGARIFALSEVRRKGMGKVIEEGLQIAGFETKKIFCSIDLDGIAQAFAPGVSAPSPEGLTPEEVSLAAYLFGLHPKVVYFDIMEMNPHFDQDGRTARLAAALILHFLSGIAARKSAVNRVFGFRGQAG